VISLQDAQSNKDWIEEMNIRMIELENALYGVLDAKDIDIAREIAAEVLNEDLETYMEEDNLDELDFDDDGNLPWDDINATEEET
jgi:hypothetical protein